MTPALDFEMPIELGPCRRLRSELQELSSLLDRQCDRLGDLRTPSPAFSGRAALAFGAALTPLVTDTDHVADTARRMGHRLEALVAGLEKVRDRYADHLDWARTSTELRVTGHRVHSPELPPFLTSSMLSEQQQAAQEQKVEDWNELCVRHEEVRTTYEKVQERWTDFLGTIDWERAPRAPRSLPGPASEPDPVVIPAMGAAPPAAGSAPGGPAAGGSIGRPAVAHAIPTAGLTQAAPSGLFAMGTITTEPLGISELADVVQAEDPSTVDHCGTGALLDAALSGQKTPTPPEELLGRS